MTKASARAAIPGWTLGASILVHAAVVGVGLVIAYDVWPWHRAAPNDARDATLEGAAIPIDLPTFGEGETWSARIPDPRGVPPVPAGGDSIARVDTQTKGHGGERAGARAIHLSDNADPMTRSTDIVSRLDRDQVQRMRTVGERRAWEDRRATLRPMELTFIVSGHGEREERRAIASDPSRGALESPQASTLGGELGAREELPRDAIGVAGFLGAPREGARAFAPGLGVHNGAPGEDHRVSADGMFARPAVVPGPPTIPALDRGRPNDRVDSDQEVAQFVRSYVHASVAGGASGEGAGGTSGGGDPGAGGAVGGGAHPRPLGTGAGDWVDFDTNDPNLLPYFRKLHAKIDPLWRNAFPRSASLELKQGLVILEFTVYADGHVDVAWPPVRPSGVPEFDRNCADALRRAVPLPPIPASLGKTAIRIRAPFDEQNPIVK